MSSAASHLLRLEKVEWLVLRLREQRSPAARTGHATPGLPAAPPGCRCTGGAPYGPDPRRVKPGKTEAFRAKHYETHKNSTL